MPGKGFEPGEVRIRHAQPAPAGAEGDVRLAQAVIVRAAGGREAEARGQRLRDLRLLGRIGRVAHLDAERPGVRRSGEHGGALRIVKAVLEDVRHDRHAARRAQGADGIRERDVIARDVKRLAPAEQAAHTVGHRGDAPALHEQRRDVRPAEHRLPREGRVQVVHRDGVARVVQALHHGLVAGIALVGRAGHERAQRGIARVHEVAEQVHLLAAPDGGQLQHMKVGQPVDIKIDTYPGKTFKGKVDSIQRSSGAKSSLFPPENAVGSFVKIVQRIPVKIVFTEKINPEEFNIVPGMSVVPKVRVR